MRAACRYNNSDQSLTLANGYKLYQNQLSEISHYGVSMLMVPIFEFAKSISRLDLDSTEVAMLAAVLLMQSGIDTYYLLWLLLPPNPHLNSREIPVLLRSLNIVMAR